MVVSGSPAHRRDRPREIDQCSLRACGLTVSRCAVSATSAVCNDGIRPDRSPELMHSQQHRSQTCWQPQRARSRTIPPLYQHGGSEAVVGSSSVRSSRESHGITHKRFTRPARHFELANGFLPAPQSPAEQAILPNQSYQADSTPDPPQSSVASSNSSGFPWFRATFRCKLSALLLLWLLMPLPEACAESLSMTTLESYWSSDPIVVPNFVSNITSQTGASCSFYIAFLEGDAGIAGLPSVDKNGTLSLPLNSDRVGGQASFSISLLWTWQTNETGNGTAAAPSVALNSTFSIVIFVGSVDFRLDAAENANLSVATLERNLTSYFELGSGQLDVEDLLGNASTSRRLLASAVSVQARVRVYTASEALSVLGALNATLLSSFLDAPVTVSAASGVFRDAAGATDLQLRVARFAVRSDAGAVAIARVVSRVRAPELPIGADGSAEAGGVEVRVLRFRESSSTGALGAWQSGAPSWLLATGNASCAVCLDSAGNLSLSVAPGVGGEVEVRLSAANGSASSVLTIAVLPVSEGPRFALAPLPLSLPEEVAFTLHILNISQGGWALAPELPVEFEWSTAGVPVIEAVDFGANCTAPGATACEAVVRPFAERFGNTTLTLTMRNAGAAFTPHAQDNFSAAVDIVFAHANAAPTFALRSPVVRVEEDSGCVLSAGAVGAAPQCNSSTPRLHRYAAYADALLGMFEQRTPEACPPSAGWTTVPGACLDQRGTFRVEASAGDASIFAAPPELSADGTLEFALKANHNGQATFNVTLTDDGEPPRSSSQLLTLFVFPINDAPSFDLVSDIAAIEGTGTSSELVISNVSAGPFEPAQSVSFDVAAGPGAAAMFSSFAVTGGDTLVFTLRPAAFGEAELYFTARDDGGVARGGVDTSPPQLLRVRVWPINDPPLFRIPNPLVRVPESVAGEVVVEGFAANISAGSPNEDCAVATVSCQSQAVTFMVDHVQRGFLFSKLPAITHSGTLSFTVHPSVSGASRVFVRLQDDAGTTDSSDTLSFDVVVAPVEHPPSFALQREVECTTLDSRTPEACNCPPATENQFTLPACGRAGADAVASVSVLKDAGNVSIDAFATRISNADGYLHASMTVFSLDNSTGRLRFQELRRDPVAAAPGMEFSTEAAASPEDTHVYAVEYDLDALLLYAKNGSELRFLDRRESVERRLRFVGFNAENRFDRTPLALSAPALSSLALMEAAGQQFVLAAAGSEPLAADVARRRRRAALPQQQGFPWEPADLWAATAALWVFSAENAVAPVATAPEAVAARFAVQQADFGIANADGVWDRAFTLACGESGCSAARPVNSLDTESCVGGACDACAEVNPTAVELASVRDLTGRAGPLVLLGPACKEKAALNTSDWDTPERQMDLRTFLMSNHQVDAMQFDGTLHPGLYLALDLNQLVTGDPATSVLPLGNFSVELWFTIEAEPEASTVAFADLSLRGLVGSQAYRRLPFCGRGWALGYRHSASLGTTFEFHLFTEGTAGASTTEWQLQSTATGAPLERGVWQHLVAVYDEPTARVYLNGAAVLEEQACASLPCGKPVYPASAGLPSTCDDKPYNFSVGVVYNGMDEMRGARSGDPFLVHQGAMHMLRLYDEALDAAVVQQQYAAKAATMAENPLEETFWTVSTQPGREAPEMDFTDMATSSDVHVRGGLDPTQVYRCEWATEEAGEMSSAVGRLRYDAGFRTHVLECSTPLWPHGVRVATMRVTRWSGAQWTPVWQKVCLDAACGFPTTTDGRLAWFWGTGATPQDTKLRNNVDAMPFRCRFVSASALLQMEAQQVVGGGSVSRVNILSGGQNYVDGTFVGDVAGNGRLLSGSFRVDDSGAVMSTSIDDRGMAYPLSGGSVVMLDSRGHRMTNSITQVNLTSSGSGFLSGSWEILGAAGSNARGTFDATDAGTSSDTSGLMYGLEIVLAGSDYRSDPSTSDLQFYFPGTQTSQEGAITRVLGANGFIPGFGSDVECIANCSSSLCTGSGFVGTCVAGGGGVLLRVDVVEYGAGYDRNHPPEMFCVIGGALLAPGGITLEPVIPSRPSVTISRASGAVLSFDAETQGLQDLSLFGLARGGLWSNETERPRWPGASAFAPFAVDNSTYFLLANWWDGVVGNKYVFSNAGRLLDRPQSFLYSWDPIRGMMACVQAIDTPGAAEWRHFRNSFGDFVAVANYQQVLSDGETTTRAWSRIHRFGNSRSAGAGSGSCSAGSDHGFSPIDQSNFTEIQTMGATGLETLILNHSTRLSLIQYLVVTNYYDSETDSTNVPSKLYMLGTPVSSTQSAFGLASTVSWRTCSDTGASCGVDNDCFIHTCSERCVVTRRGNVIDKVCRCSNNGRQSCREDDECNTGLTCAFGNVDIQPEDHSACFADGSVRFVGSNYENLVTACEMQTFDVERATDVAYIRKGLQHFLVFASDSESPTKTYVTTDGSEPFVLLQSVASKYATGVRFFYSPFADHLYLILMQRQESTSLILRFDGASFVFDHSISVDGGQAGLYLVHRDVEYGVFGGSTSSVAGKTLLFQAYDDTLPSLEGPNSVIVSPDGLHVYVASLASSSILCFLREPTEGTLALLSSTSIDTLGSVSLSGVSSRADNYGYPLCGILDLVSSSDGMNVYLAASQDNAIHTFWRNLTSGELHYHSSVTDPDRQKMMQGPRQLVASADGTRVYAVCVHSQSVVALDRSPSDGSLTYRDTIVNGERRVVSLESEVRPGREGYPLQLGAASGERWKDAVRGAQAFSINGQHLLAIAASDDNSDGSGIAVVLAWNATTARYEVHQELVRETSAADVEFFEVTNLDGDRFAYLAVANADGWIRVYVWVAADGRFTEHHDVPALALPFNVTSGCSCRCAQPSACGACFEDSFTFFPPCPTGVAGCQYTALPLSPRRMRHFVVAQTGEHFLAVANYNSVGASCTDSFSVIYRWNGDAPRSSQGQAVWGYGFEAFQAVDTRGALDVDFVSIEEGGETRNLLFIANFAQGSDGEAIVWEHAPYLYNHLLQARAGRFELRQRISGQGVSSVHPLKIDDDGYFLAVGHRQTAPFTGDISVYSVNPQLMKWNGTMFVPYQTLMGQSVPDESSYFPDPPPAPNVSAIPGAPTWTSLSVLAGTTGFTFFEDLDGELYLVISQSFCDPLTNSSTCMSQVSQPQSAVLQWDRTNKEFTEMLAWADQLYEQVHGEPVHEEIRRYHQSALRMPVGRALQVEAVTIGGEVLLVVCSQDKGATVIRWVFDTSPGFGGAMTLAVDASHRFLYTASELEQSVVVIGLAPSVDSVGNPVSIFEHVQSLSRLDLRGVVDPVPEGLRGVRSIEVEEQDCTGYTTGGRAGSEGPEESAPLAEMEPGTMCSVVVVRGSVPRNQMPCSDHSAQPVAVDPLEPPLECRDFSLNTTMINSSNPNLFEVQPFLVPSGPMIGMLNFTLTPGQSGFARFEAVLTKSASSNPDLIPMLVSETLLFDVFVVDINDAPTFVLLDVEVSMDGGVQEAVFAVNITAEGLGVANYSWEWEYTGVNCSLTSVNCTNGTVSGSYLPAVFARDPVLRFEQTGMGLVGVINVEVVPLLHDDVFLLLRMNDGSEPDPRTGASHVSEPTVLTIRVVPVNHAPTFVPNPAYIEIMEGEPQVVQNFITRFDNGPPIENNSQPVFYEVAYVEDVNVAGWNTSGIFRQFAVMGTTLSFELHPDFNGEIVVFIRVFDNGGTERGGADSSLVPLSLKVLAINDPPVLQGNGRANFRCAMTFEAPRVVTWAESVVSKRNALQSVECSFSLAATGVLNRPSTLCGYAQADNAREAWLDNPFGLGADQDTVDWELFQFWDPVQNGPTRGQEAFGDWYAALDPKDIRPGHPRTAGDFAYLQSARLPWVDDDAVLTQTPGVDVTDFRVERILDATVSFWFVMYGNTVGELSVSVRYDGGPWRAIPAVEVGGLSLALPLVGRQQVTRDDWTEATFTLDEAEISGRDVEIRFEATTGFGQFDSTAIDTITITSDVEVDLSQERCTMEFNITGVLVDSVRELEGAFVVEQPLDEILVQDVSFHVNVLSGFDLFFTDPYVTPNGTFVLPLSRAGRGTSRIEVTVTDSEGLNNTYPVLLRVDDFAELPPFSLRPLLEVVDGDGLRSEPLFAVVTSLEEVPESARQYIRFTVECTTTAAGMFEAAPALDSLGTLSWAVRAGFSGRAQCTVVLQAQEAGIEDAAPQTFAVRVWPRPQLLQVVPAVLPARQLGAVVTVRGRNFGSLRSRGYGAAVYGNVTVMVSGALRGGGWAPCARTVYVGDGELLCEVPAGEGQRDVKVEVLDRINRTGVSAGALVSADMWFVGVAEDEHCASVGMPWPHRQEAIAACGTRGFLGFSPLAPGAQELGEAALNVSSSVRAVAVMGGRVYVGGGFPTVNGQRVNSIFGWDGATYSPLELGLDGSVAALRAVTDSSGVERLVVAGSFTRAYTRDGGVLSGGVAVWDGAAWAAAGGAQLHGVALCLAARGSAVLVGGKFSAVGDLAAQNVAVLDGGEWVALGSGVVGEVYACAMSSAVMYVGGKVGKAGDVEVENVAGWNGRSWGALLDGECLHKGRSVCGISGRVLSMATVGEYLYVGGMFDMAGGKPANNVARFYSGVWEPLGGGVDGPVTVMSSMRVAGSVSGSCVYIAGEFRTATDLTGDTEVGGLARWCVGDPVLVRAVGNQVVSEFWQAVAVPEGVKGIRTMASHTQ